MSVSSDGLLMTVVEAAAFFGMHPAYVSKLCRDGLVGATRAERGTWQIDPDLMRSSLGRDEYPPEGWLSVAIAAREFSYSQEHLRRLCRAGGIKCCKGRGGWIIHAETLAEYAISAGREPSGEGRR